MRQQQREKRTLCSAQTTNTITYIKNTCKSKRLATTAHTNSLRDRQHSNKVSHSSNYKNINLSEGADGIDVEDKLTTPPQGVPIAA